LVPLVHLLSVSTVVLAKLCNVQLAHACTQTTPQAGAQMLPSETLFLLPVACVIPGSRARSARPATTWTLGPPSGPSFAVCGASRLRCMLGPLDLLKAGQAASGVTRFLPRPPSITCHYRIQTLCRVSGTLGKAPITLGKSTRQRFYRQRRLCRVPFVGHSAKESSRDGVFAECP
jgi:hypothetical protein